MHRAFVVHLASFAGRKRRRFIGRVEHLSSGEGARFSSLDALLAFFERLADGREDPRGPLAPGGLREFVPGADTGPRAKKARS